MSAPERVRVGEAELADLARRSLGLGEDHGSRPDGAPRTWPAGTELVDAEGAVVAVAAADGSAVPRPGTLPARWPSPERVRAALADRGWGEPATWTGWPDGPVQPPALVLLPSAGVRPDDAALSAAAAAWALALPRERDRLVVQVPLDPAAAAATGPALAAAYGGRWAGGRLAPEGRRPGAGVAVLLTGLSGAGKSTIAAAVVDVLVDRGRSVTLLDGDEVRTHLSAGLGFSAADRDTNVRRIGWVAAQVVKHGGVAVCAPIAPHDAVRREVRALVEAQGGPGSFVLVHVATPLAECERRDRKGLYARARRGEVAEFTGVSAPYDAPTDAELVLDTTDLAVADAARAVVDVLDR